MGKKIRGNLHYFGPWDKPEAALQQFVDQRDRLCAGRKPRSVRDRLDARELLNRFLTSKLRQLEIAEITNRTFLDYKATCERIRDTFGVSRLVDDPVRNSSDEGQSGGSTERSATKNSMQEKSSSRAGRRPRQE